MFGLPRANWQAASELNEQSSSTRSAPVFAFKHQRPFGVLGRPPHQVWPWKNCAAAGLAERQSGAATAKAAITNEMRIEF